MIIKTIFLLREGFPSYLSYSGVRFFGFFLVLYVATVLIVNQIYQVFCGLFSGFWGFSDILGKGFPTSLRGRYHR